MPASSAAATAAGGRVLVTAMMPYRRRVATRTARGGGDLRPGGGDARRRVVGGGQHGAHGPGDRSRESSCRHSERMVAGRCRHAAPIGVLGCRAGDGRGLPQARVDHRLRTRHAPAGRHGRSARNPGHGCAARRPGHPGKARRGRRPTPNSRTSPSTSSSARPPQPATRIAPRRSRGPSLDSYPDSIWAGLRELDVGRVRRRTGDLNGARRLVRSRCGEAARPASATAAVADLQRAEVPTSSATTTRPWRWPTICAIRSRAGWSMRRVRRLAERIRQSAGARAEPGRSVSPRRDLRLAEGDAQGAQREALVGARLPGPTREARDHALWIQARAERALGHAGSGRGALPGARHQRHRSLQRASARPGRTLALERGRRRRRAAALPRAGAALPRQPRGAGGALRHRTHPAGSRRPTTTRSASYDRARASAIRPSRTAEEARWRGGLGPLPRAATTPARPRAFAPSGRRRASARPAWPPSTGRRARSRTPATPEATAKLDARRASSIRRDVLRRARERPAGHRDRPARRRAGLGRASGRRSPTCSPARTPTGPGATASSACTGWRGASSTPSRRRPRPAPLLQAYAAVEAPGPALRLARILGHGRRAALPLSARLLGGGAPDGRVARPRSAAGRGAHPAGEPVLPGRGLARRRARADAAPAAHRARRWPRPPDVPPPIARRCTGWRPTSTSARRCCAGCSTATADRA